MSSRRRPVRRSLRVAAIAAGFFTVSMGTAALAQMPVPSSTSAQAPATAAGQVQGGHGRQVQAAAAASIGASASAAPRASSAAPSAAAPSAASSAAPSAGPSTPPSEEQAAPPPSHGAMAGLFQAPEDEQGEDPRLPAGTVAIRILDAQNRPVPNTPVTIGILYNSVAKGENRKQLQKQTDAEGNLVLSGLETGSGIAYRVSVPFKGGTFAASPFQLPLGQGVRVGLHVYDVTNDIEQSMVVAEAFVYVELKDDRLQIQQAFRFHNFGPIAWVPKDLELELPEGHVALNAQQGMSDVGITPIEGRGYRIRGTFGPGQNDVEFRWQLPYSEDANVDIPIALPPHIARARVLAPAGQGMRLVVENFPPAEAKTDGQGQRILITDRQLVRSDAPLKELKVSLRDIPVEGPARKVVTAFAALVAVAGLALAFRSRSGRTKADFETEREHLLSDLEELERAHRAGDVGPKTYEAARRELIDALARTFATAA